MSNRTVIQCDKAPKAVGPYSQAIASGDWIFFSGQIPVDPATGKLVEGTVAEQAERVLQNIQALLESVGCTFQNVVKSTVFMVDLKSFSAMNEVYAKYFHTEPPARSTVQVAALPLGSQLEIEVIVHRS